MRSSSEVWKVQKQQVQARKLPRIRSPVHHRSGRYQSIGSAKQLRDASGRGSWGSIRLDMPFVLDVATICNRPTVGSVPLLQYLGLYLRFHPCLVMSPCISPVSCHTLFSPRISRPLLVSLRLQMYCDNVNSNVAIGQKPER